MSVSGVYYLYLAYRLPQDYRNSTETLRFAQGDSQNSLVMLSLVLREAKGAAEHLYAGAASKVAIAIKRTALSC